MEETTTVSAAGANAAVRPDTNADTDPDINADNGVGKRYAKLVRLAYLVLPATGRRSYRLAIAQRIVDASLPRRSWGDGAADRVLRGAYAPIRSQVLRQAMRPSPRLRIGLGPRLRRLPRPGPPTPGRLAALDPAVRAAYVLRRVESLPRSMVREQLVQIGVPDAAEVIRAADQVPELTLPRVVPGPPLPRRSRVPIGVAGVLTVAALVAAQAGPPGQRAASDRRAAAPEHRATPQHRAAPVRAGRTTAAPGALAAPVASARARPAADAGPRVTAVVFWAGRLPGGVPARWTCRHVVRPGRPAAADGILVAARRRQRTDCGRVNGTTVGGAWWRAPGGRWYFVAAAGGRGFLVKVTPPPSFARRAPVARRGLVVVPGPRGGARPPRGRMTVTARRM
ncbi:MAG TPA: hypothetical protein VFU43_17165 [Streptosporangiaceae bacterium]|nr:hypothetical protein [Streptosporangiaceae bacterium]